MSHKIVIELEREEAIALGKILGKESGPSKKELGINEDISSKISDLYEFLIGC